VGGGKCIAEKGLWCYSGLQRNRHAEGREVSKIRQFYLTSWCCQVCRQQHFLVNGQLSKCLCGLTCSLHIQSVLQSLKEQWKGHTARAGRDVFTPCALLSHQNIPQTAKRVNQWRLRQRWFFSKSGNQIRDDISDRTGFKRRGPERWTKPKNHATVDSSPDPVSLLTVPCAYKQPKQSPEAGTKESCCKQSQRNLCMWEASSKPLGWKGWHKN